MNATQLKYARERLREVLASKLEVARTAASQPAQKFDAAALVKGIKNGSIKINVLYEDDDNVETYTSVGSVFDISAHVKQANFDVKAFRKVEKVINEEAQRIEDQLVLGDSQEALALIEAFAKKKF